MDDDRLTLVRLRQTTRDECLLLIALTYMNIVNYMDRVGIAAVLVHIEFDLDVGDDYGGLLQTALLVSFTIMAPIFGYLGDHYDRKFLIVGSICLWAVSTVIGAHVGRYWILLFSRILVGIGQSGFTTISPSLISDISVKGTRSLFLSCFYIGIPIGAGLGYVVVVFLTNITGLWTWAVCVGPVLCVIGMVMLTICKFPAQGAKEMFQTAGVTNFKRDFVYLMEVPSFITLTVAFSNGAFLTGAMSWWLPSCYFYGFQLIPEDPTAATMTLGTLTISSGIMAILLGFLLSRCLRPHFPSCDPFICGAGQLIAFPLVEMSLCMASQSKVWSFLFIFIGELNININWAISTDMLLYVVVPNRRSIAQGVYMFIGHGLGDCVSPYVLGIMSEHFQQKFKFANNSILPVPTNEAFMQSRNQHFHSIQLSLMLASFTMLLAACFYFLTGRIILDDMKRAESQNVAGNTI